MKTKPIKKICFVVTTELSVNAFLLNHLNALSKNYDVTLIVNTQNTLFLSKIGINVKVIPLDITRKISPISDIKCLFRLIQIFRQEKFDATHSVTPKAGLLNVIAGYIAGIPLRIHTFTGQVWATKKGFKRFFLKFFDRLIATLASHAIVDSASQLEFLVRERIINPIKAFVFGKGSISGVNLDKFKPNAQARINLRKKIKIDDDALLFLFLGRLNPDKGVVDLANAYIKAKLEKTKLLFVGPDEANMKLVIQSLPNFDDSKISFIDYTSEPESFMAASDVLCLPSYREGFGSVIIEAAACGIPAIASRIYGVVDAVDEGKTGLLHAPKNIDDLQSKLEIIYKDQALRLRLAENAYRRAVSEFNSDRLTQAWCEFYKKTLFRDD